MCSSLNESDVAKGFLSSGPKQGADLLTCTRLFIDEFIRKENIYIVISLEVTCIHAAYKENVGY